MQDYIDSEKDLLDWDARIVLSARVQILRDDLASNVLDDPASLDYSLEELLAANDVLDHGWRRKVILDSLRFFRGTTDFLPETVLQPWAGNDTHWQVRYREWSVKRARLMEKMGLDEEPNSDDGEQTGEV